MASRKRKWLIVLVLVLVIGLGFIGFSVFLTSRSQTLLTIDGQRYEIVGEFSEKVSTSGLPLLPPRTNITILPPELVYLNDIRVKDAIDEQIRKFGGTEVIDIKIKYYDRTIIQNIIGILTPLSPVTLIVSGNVVKAIN